MKIITKRPRSRSNQPINPTKTALRSTQMHPNNLLLINEAMSRARMLWPQDTISEASQPARMIAMRARATQRRIRGHQ
jgi:hypothetical protein